MTPREIWTLPTRHIGRRVHVHDTLGSTSDAAAALADDAANDGTAVFAYQQEAGRGQYGRSWLCPPGAGVLMSVLLFPPPPLRRPAVLTAWAATAVADVAEELTGRAPRLKWPNDVLIEGKKVCGILIEQGRGTVAGMGLNVNQPAEAFHEAGLPDAASLAVFSGATRDVATVAQRLLTRLDDGYADLLAGHFAALEDSWRRRLGFEGEDVIAETASGPVRGRLHELTFDVVTVGATRLKPEAVRHLLSLARKK